MRLMQIIISLVKLNERYNTGALLLLTSASLDEAGCAWGPHELFY